MMRGVHAHKMKGHERNEGNPESKEMKLNNKRLKVKGACPYIKGRIRVGTGHKKDIQTWKKKDRGKRTSCMFTPRDHH